jgi:hypothetical protein
MADTLAGPEVPSGETGYYEVFGTLYDTIYVEFGVHIFACLRRDDFA